MLPPENCSTTKSYNQKVGNFLLASLFQWANLQMSLINALDDLDVSSENNALPQSNVLTE
ncbi:20138_t:CDS:1, partial [Dentiscutata erythropus]